MWYFRQRTRKWSRKFSKIIFSSRKIDFKKKVFSKISEKSKLFFLKFWDFDIWQLLGHAYCPLCTRRCFLDGFRWFSSESCTSATSGYFFSGFSIDFPSDSITGDLEQIWNFQFMGGITHPPRDALFSPGNWIIMKITLFNDFWQRSFRS